MASKALFFDGIDVFGPVSDASNQSSVRSLSL